MNTNITNTGTTNTGTTNETTLKWAYTGNILLAGIPGAVMIGLPEWARANMFAGTQDPAMFGMTGSIWLAIGLGSMIGLRNPQLMKGIFFVQILYKTIWVLTVALPLLLQGNMTVVPMAIFFVLAILGFSYVLSGETFLRSSENPTTEPTAR